MAVSNSQIAASLLTNHQALFHRDFHAAQALQGWMQFTSRLRSTKEIESYDWFGTTPVMQDTTHGELQLAELHKYAYTRTNRVYQAGFAIKREAMDDDSLGLLPPRVTQLAQEGARFPGQLVLALFETPGTAYDGTAFFADARTIGDSANIDNEVEVTSAAAVPTIAEFQSYLAQAQARMLKFQDDKGRVMNIRGDTIVVPAEILQVAWQALSGSGTPGSVSPVAPITDNGIVQAGGYALYCNPQLTDVNDWYLLHTRGAVKPFFWQERVAPRMESTPTSGDRWITKREVIHSAYMRGAEGVGDPRHAVKIVDAGS